MSTDENVMCKEDWRFMLYFQQALQNDRIEDAKRVYFITDSRFVQSQMARALEARGEYLSSNVDEPLVRDYVAAQINLDETHRRRLYDEARPAARELINDLFMSPRPPLNHKGQLLDVDTAIIANMFFGLELTTIPSDSN